MLMQTPNKLQHCLSYNNKQTQLHSGPVEWRPSTVQAAPTFLMSKFNGTCRTNELASSTMHAPHCYAMHTTRASAANSCNDTNSYNMGVATSRITGPLQQVIHLRCRCAPLKVGAPVLFIEGRLNTTSRSSKHRVDKSSSNVQHRLHWTVLVLSRISEP